MALPVLLLARRYPIREAGKWRHVGLHLAASVVAASLQLLLAGLFFEAMQIGQARVEPFMGALAYSFRHNFHLGLLTYWAIVGVLHLRDFDRGLRQKMLVESRLREQLVSAELAALRMQLHPHFLFNALHSISALLYSDPAAADAMLVRLSDLLRRSLETRSDVEISLDRELDFARGYLELAGMRHGDRLRAEIDVEMELRSALVPTFILQPLVENSVLHGVETSTVPCRLAVRARHQDEHLVIEVENDIDANPRRRDREGAGLGLSNTRARLAQLYGASATLQLELEPGRRALARILLPFHTTAPVPANLESQPLEAVR